MPELTGELVGIPQIYTFTREKIFPEKHERFEGTAHAEVLLIQQALGVEFTDTPKKVKPHFRDLAMEANNIVKHAFSDQNKTKIGKFVGSALTGIKTIIHAEMTRGGNGFYSPLSNTCYYRGDVEYSEFDLEEIMPELLGVSMDTLHETMHAYHNQRTLGNANIGFEGVDSFAEISKEVSSKRLQFNEARTILESAIVGRIAAEGIAEYGSRATNTHILELWEERAAQVKWHERLIRSRMEQVNTHNCPTINISPENITKQLGNIDKLVTELTNMFRNKKNPVFQLKALLPFLKMNDAIYPVGFFFVSKSIVLLTEYGMTKGTALSLLITNPPQTMNEISNPDLYIQRIKPPEMKT